jgi:hypothetical protein
MSTALNKIVAVEKGTKSETTSQLSRVYKEIQKTGLFGGLNRTYQPVDDDGTQYPPEGVRVQRTADDVIMDASVALTKLFDVVATKDWGNCEAKADIVVGDEVILSKVPITYLLFLEKQLTDLKAFISKLPTLDPAEEWTFNDQKSLFQTQPVKTHKTQKVPRVVVKYDATPEHPAQTEMFTEDIIVGHWTNTKFSGALPMSRVRELSTRVIALRDAVKTAREEANSTKVDQIRTGEKVLTWLFK